jgi:transposase
MDKPISYVGLDVHKDTIAVALAEMGKRGEVREHGKIANTPAALNMLAAKLARAGAELRFCYEAGPCGYGIERQLTAAGHGCVVVAPSSIPRKPGARIKTDRRDAINLANCTGPASRPRSGCRIRRTRRSAIWWCGLSIAPGAMLTDRTRTKSSS